MSSMDVTMVVDTRKDRIRFRKAALHQLGDPVRIQLLVHPEKKLVAIRSVEQERAGDQSYKISQNVFTSDFCFEIYSRSFIVELCRLVGKLETGCYRMSGRVLPRDRAAVFYLNSLARYDLQERAHE